MSNRVISKVGKRAKGAPRERLIRDSIKLFQERGYHAAGIDTVIKRAGVAKRTLYSEFGSKETLIVECLRAYNDLFSSWLKAEVERHAPNPRDRLLQVFKQAGHRFSQPSFNGCMFIKASSEFPDRSSKIHRECRVFNAAFERYLYSLAKEAKLKSPEHLGYELLILFQGMMVLTQILDRRKAVQQAISAAKRLIDAHSI